MSLDHELLDILVCPVTKEPLIYFEQEDFLFSPEAKLKYPIEDGIPVMLEEEAESVDEEAAKQLLEQAEKEGLQKTAQTEAD